MAEKPSQVPDKHSELTNSIKSGDTPDDQDLKKCIYETKAMWYECMNCHQRFQDGYCMPYLGTEELGRCPGCRAPTQSLLPI